MTKLRTSARNPPAEPSVPARGSLLFYAIIGLSGVLLDYLLFVTLFNGLGWHPQVANAISTTAGITNNFVLNAVFNFRTTDRLLRRFFRFYVVGLAGIALTFGLLHVLSGGLGLDPNLVKAGSLPLVLLVQYTLNRRWSFA